MALHTATIFSSTLDGSLQSVDPTYTDAADGVGGAVITNDPGTINEIRVGQLLFGDYACYEGFVDFSLAAIPANSQIVTATLGLHVVSTNFGSATLGAREYDFGASVTSADWQDRAELTALSGGVNLTTVTSAALVSGVGGYVDWATNPQLAAAVKANIGGSLRLALFSGNHRAGIAPTAGEFVQFASANSVNDPRLVVEYTPGAPPPFQRTTPRVWRLAGRT